MSNILIKQYTFTNSTASSHFSKSGGMNLGQAGLVSNPLILWYSNSGTATMNATGKSFLYPKAGIHPFKADYTFILWNGTDSDFTSSPSSYMNFYFKIDDNTIYHKEVAPGKTSSPSTASDAITDDTNPAILNSTSSSSIVFEITAQKNGLTQMCGISSTNDYQCFIKFYYQQWDLTAEAIGNGFRCVKAPNRVFNTETVTYSATLKEDAIWQGWYADINHTQLVSTDLNYTITATQDLKLYAYALYSNNYDDIYLKSPLTGTWIIPSKFYIKTINGWEFKSDPSTILSTNDKFRWPVTVAYGKLSTISTLNIDLSAVPYTRDFLLIENDMQGYNLTNYTCTHPNKISVIDYSSMNATIVTATSVSLGSATCKVTLTYENYDYTSSKTVTLNITEKIETKTIYFKDQNENNFTETINQNAAYTVTTPTGYTNFIGWKEFYGNEPTGRILQIGQSYYDVGQNKMVHYEPVFNE